MNTRRASKIIVAVAFVCVAAFVGHSLYQRGMDSAKSVPGSANPTYDIADIGTGEAFHLNNAGQVVGMTEFRPSRQFGDHPGAAYGFIYRDGGRTEMGTFGGPWSGAERINGFGQVLGDATTPQLDPRKEYSGAFVSHPFLWNSGKMVDLSRIPDYTNIDMRVFAPDGRILVSATPAGSRQRHAYLYDTQKMQDLGSLGRCTAPLIAINASNRIVSTVSVGSYIDRYGRLVTKNHACLWQKGKIWDLGTLGGLESQPEAINDRGQIVGKSELKDGESHAFLWEKGKMRDLGTLTGPSLENSSYPSWANSINNRGQVVGWAVAPETGNHHGVIWHNGQMKALDGLVPKSSDWTSIESAQAINDKGQIIGEGIKIGDSHSHSYLLTPIK